jgi:hypothetical protein
VAAPGAGNATAAVPSGLLVSDAMAAVLAVVSGLGVVVDRPLLTALGACVLALTLLSRVWTRHALDGVRCVVTASPARAVAGDDVELIVTLENHKRTPVPWLRVQEPLPPGLVLDAAAGQPRGTFGTSWLTATRHWARARGCACTIAFAPSPAGTTCWARAGSPPAIPSVSISRSGCRCAATQA